MVSVYTRIVLFHPETSPNHPKTRRFVMAKAVLGTSQLNIPEKIQRDRQIITALTGNTTFATPSPALATITTAIDKLEDDFNDALGKRQTAQAATNIQNESEAALDRLMAALAGYVDSVALGDEDKIMSAGMTLKQHRGPVVQLTQVADLSAASGDMDGEIDLNWQPKKGAASYTIVKSATGNVATAGNWTPAATSTKSKTTVTGLTSGTRYWFRVAAIGSAGQGPWSDPATAIAS
jgi:hypothetical protein